MYIVPLYSTYHIYQICLSRIPQWVSRKESACNEGRLRDAGSIPELGRSPGGENGNPHLVFLPGKSHGQRNPVGYSP